MAEKYPPLTKRPSQSFERETMSLSALVQQEAERYDRISSRRSFLHAVGNVAALATVGAVSWDTMAEVLRDHNRVVIETLHDEQAEAAFPHTTTLYFPGLKNTWGESAANLRALQPALREFSQMASVGYSNRGFDEDEIYDEVVDYLTANDIHTVNLYGGSMGGLLSIALAARLGSAGFNVPTVFCDSTPGGPEDVRDQATFQCMVWGYQAGLTLPECFRFLGEFEERCAHKNERSLSQIWEESWEQLGPRACSSELVQSQTYYISRFRLQDYDEKLGKTKVVYLGNEGDVVVDHNRAFAQFAKKLPRHFVPTTYTTEGAYHASPQWYGQQYCQEIGLIAKDLHLIPRRSSVVKYY